jgi:hypothetical protein
MATPPALQGNTAIIGPDEPEALAWYQVLERRAVGRGVGLALLSGAGITLAALARPWTWFSGTSSTRMVQPQRGSLVAIPVGLSVVALIAGLRLRTKKYYKDPEALREYIQTYHNSSFAHAFKQFDSWEGLFRGTRPFELAKAPFSYSTQTALSDLRCLELTHVLVISCYSWHARG